MKKDSNNKDSKEKLDAFKAKLDKNLSSLEGSIKGPKATKSKGEIIDREIKDKKTDSPKKENSVIEPVSDSVVNDDAKDSIKDKKTKSPKKEESVIESTSEPVVTDNTSESKKDKKTKSPKKENPVIESVSDSVVNDDAEGSKTELKTDLSENKESNPTATDVSDINKSKDSKTVGETIKGTTIPDKKQKSKSSVVYVVLIVLLAGLGYLGYDFFYAKGELVNKINNIVNQELNVKSDSLQGLEKIDSTGTALSNFDTIYYEMAEGDTTNFMTLMDSIYEAELKASTKKNK